MSQPPRVLHVVESWRPVVSGYTSRSWHIVQQQAALGISRPRVLVTSRQRVYGQATADTPPGLEGGEVIVCEPTARERVTRSVRGFDLDRRALVRRIAEEAVGCDLIHVHWSSGIGQAAADAARQRGLPLVAEVRFDLAGAMASETLGDRLPALERPLRRWFERHLSHAGGIVAASHSLGRLLERDFPAVRGRITVVPNGVEPPASTDRQATRDHLGLGETHRAIGTTSKMLRYEGLTTLIDAAANTERGVAMLVGDGPRRAALERYARSVQAQARFTGRIPGARIPDHLAAMDLFAIPRLDTTITRYASPIKATEAMAAGLPVIATAVGDLPELLAEGRGILVQPGDPAAFIRAADELANDPQRRAAMGARAARWVQQTLAWDAVVRRYSGVYTGALS